MCQKFVLGSRSLGNQPILMDNVLRTWDLKVFFQYLSVDYMRQQIEFFTERSIACLWFSKIHVVRSIALKMW
jgi:hypothetical protein